MKVIRHYEYACNGYAIRHISFDDRYFIEHPVNDNVYGVTNTLKSARTFAMSLTPLY